MPRFFFDITDGVTTIDDAGTDLPNAHAARNEAIKVLPDIARDEIGKRQSREVSVLMRDVEGRNLFTASLTLTTHWLIEAA